MDQVNKTKNLATRNFNDGRTKLSGGMLAMLFDVKYKAFICVRSDSSFGKLVREFAVKSKTHSVNVN